MRNIRHLARFKRPVTCVGGNVHNEISNVAFEKSDDEKLRQIIYGTMAFHLLTKRNQNIGIMIRADEKKTMFLLLLWLP